MWWVVQNLFPNHALDAWLLVGAFWFWLSVLTWQPYIIRQLPVMILWTDIFNMVTVEFFNMPPTWWWAHGWTVALIPLVGRFWVAFIPWIIMVFIYGDSLWMIGFGIGKGNGYYSNIISNY